MERREIWPSPVPEPDEPLKIALIGAGNRATVTYLPILPALARWVTVVAVCDPIRENSDRMAQALRAKAYYDIRQLVADRPMEAAIVVTGGHQHHAVSVYLSSHGIHNHTETPWANMLCQAREMMETARRNNVVARLAENFLRTPIDRFAQVVRDTGYLGRIGRIFCYADHTGHHTNSRWIAFAGRHPDWVQCVEHEMAHPPFYGTPNALQERERLSARFYHFPDDFLVMDTGSGQGKGRMGRHARPGYTEWQGELGTLVYRAPTPYWADTEAELRKISPDRLAPAQETAEHYLPGGIADQISTVSIETRGVEWATIGAWTPEGRIEYVNPFCDYLKDTPKVEPAISQSRKERTAVADHIVDFALAVRGMRKSEFTDEDALMSTMMVVAARESALQDGRRIALPLEGDVEADALERKRQREQCGVDPLDVEAMLAASSVRP